MSFEEEDPFWNSSDVKAFNFDDEDQGSLATNLTTNYASSTTAPSSSDVKTLGSILAARSSSGEPFLRPSMITCERNKIEELLEHLDNSYPTLQFHGPTLDPKTYVREIIDNRVPIDFSPYKSKRDKLLLLDCAICCSDGNTITAAAIFMSRTLKESIFIEELKKRPVAVDHFINYLQTMGKSREVIDLNRKLTS